MNKKTVLVFWVIGFVVALIGAGMLAVAIVAAANHCTVNQFGGEDCSLPPTDPLTYIGLIGLLILCVGGCLGAVAWIMALIRNAATQTWGWFVVVLLFTGLGTLIYLLAGPSDQMRAAADGASYPAY